MSEERTVAGVLRAALGPYYGIYGITDEDVGDAAHELGIDPGMSVSRLREDLAIAARVRACEPTVGAVSTGTKDFKRGAAFGWNAALAYLLQGDQP